jgi:hypothetical protein
MSKSIGFIFYVYEKERGMSESCKSATGLLAPAFPQRNKPIKIEHLRLVVSSATPQPRHMHESTCTVQVPHPVKGKRHCS